MSIVLQRTRRVGCCLRRGAATNHVHCKCTIAVVFFWCTPFLPVKTSGARVVISQIFACGFHPPGCWNLKPTVLASSECSQQGNCELNTLSTVLHQWSAMKNMLEQEVTMLNMPRPNMCQPYRPIARRQGLTMYWATTPVYRCERHVKTSNCFRKWEVCNKDLRWVATNSARLACMGQGAWME